MPARRPILTFPHGSSDKYLARNDCYYYEVIYYYVSSSRVFKGQAQLEGFEQLFERLLRRAVVWQV